MAEKFDLSWRPSGDLAIPTLTKKRRDEARGELGEEKVGRRARGATSLSPVTMVCSSPGRRRIWSNDCCDNIFM